MTLDVPLKSSPENGQKSEERTPEAEECSEDCPIELLEEDKIGPAVHHQATVGKPDEDHAEKRAEEESARIASYEDRLAQLKNLTAKESVFTIFKSVSH